MATVSIGKVGRELKGRKAARTSWFFVMYVLDGSDKSPDPPGAPDCWIYRWFFLPETRVASGSGTQWWVSSVSAGPTSRDAQALFVFLVPRNSNQTSPWTHFLPQRQSSLKVEISPLCSPPNGVGVHGEGPVQAKSVDNFACGKARDNISITCSIASQRKGPKACSLTIPQIAEHWNRIQMIHPAGQSTSALRTMGPCSMAVWMKMASRARLLTL